MTWFIHSVLRFFLVGALIANGSELTRDNMNPLAPDSPSFPILAASRVTADSCVRKIAFTSFRDPQGNGEIFMMNDDGSNQTRLTVHSAVDLSPSWSPDGSMMAFQSDRDNLEDGRSDIYLMNEDGSNIRRLTTNPAFDEGPAWSPDGTRIAFVSTRDDPDNNRRQLYVMNADGSGQTRLTFGSTVDGLSWSPDSSQIAFTSYTGTDTGSDIFVISAGGGLVRRLTTDPNYEGSPAWSPDGGQIAFMFYRAGPGQHSDLYVMNADGSDRRNLTDTPNISETGPAWSPDGSAIAFVITPDFGSSDIYVMYPDGSGQTRLTSSPELDAGSAWQPNPSAPPCLLTEPGTERAIALDSVTLTPEPFSLITDRNFSADHRTRIMLFARDLRFLPESNPPAVTAEAHDAQQRIIPLEVEFVGKVPNHQWLTQINIKLAEDLSGAGDVRISIRFDGMDSNKPFIKVASESTPPSVSGLTTAKADRAILR